MGFTSAWAITSHIDSDIAELTPRLLPAIRADRGRPEAQHRWREWLDAPLPDHNTWYGPPGLATVDLAAVEAFRELTAPGRHVDDVCGGITDPAFYVVDEVWEGQTLESMFISVHSKEYAVASFLHSIGPTRAKLLPGWCGNFILTSAQVRRRLPAVERALTFSATERVTADTQDWLDYSDGEERVLDGPLRVWRAAAHHGLGLCGLSVHLS